MVIQVLKGKHDLKCSTFLLPLLWLLESYCEEFIFQAKTSVGPATVASGKWQLNKDGFKCFGSRKCLFLAGYSKTAGGTMGQYCCSLKI